MKKIKVKKYITIGALAIVIGILSIIVYQSYAYFKVNYTRNIVNATVGFFGQTEFEYAYTGTVQEFVVPMDGYYEIELWGASGGNDLTYSIGGYGAYTKGLIELNRNEVIYIYVGGVGVTDSNTANTFNGGGGGQARGGGATDIRLIKASPTNNTIWNESVSLRSRIMIAGGGGGSDTREAGGSAGGLIGYNSTGNYGKGGTQMTGGAGYAAGGFGYGGTAGTANGGGGGGYYGGGSSTNINDYSGGGGSSYISGYAGINSIQQTGGTATQPLHTNNTLHYSGKYFLNGSMETWGSSGNGSAKITYIGQVERINTNLNNVRYIKSCANGNSVNIFNHWAEIQAIKDGINVAKGKTVTGTGATVASVPFTVVTDGDTSTRSDSNTGAGATTRLNQCVTVDLGAVYDLDEIALWLVYAGDGRRYNDNVLSVGSTNISGTTPLSTVLHNYPGSTGYAETIEGKRYTVNKTFVGCPICSGDNSLACQIINASGGACAIYAKVTPNFSSISTNETTGMYASLDDYGVSYYFRGSNDLLNNNVIFAGFQWKIIRINGDNSIRLIYNGTKSQFDSAGTMNVTGVNTQIGTSVFGSFNNKIYVGYMYNNATNSTVKGLIDTWYSTNILNRGYDAKVSDTLFCGDRSGERVGGPTIMYVAFDRLQCNDGRSFCYLKKPTPTLKCLNKNDRYTVNDTITGNGVLTYKAALLTADEAMFAGGLSATTNSAFYLNNGLSNWTMTPDRFTSDGWATNWLFNGSVDPMGNGYASGIRPVINLSPSVQASGTGSATDPYIIQD